MQIALLVSLMVSLGLAAQPARVTTAVRPPIPMTVGWHDELDDPARWQLISRENPPDVYEERPGALTLRLPHVPEGYAYKYQWNGVARSMSADLDRFPVLVARLSSLQEGSYAHLDVEERDIKGKPVRTWRSPTLLKAGLTSIDMGQAAGGAVRRLTVRLIVGGKLEGAKCEYTWVRFVRRQDLDQLRARPDYQLVTSHEPDGNDWTRVH